MGKTMRELARHLKYQKLRCRIVLRQETRGLFAGDLRVLNDLMERILDPRGVSVKRQDGVRRIGWKRDFWMKM